MPQLQLYTVKNLRGLINLVNINPTEDILHNVHDYKSILKSIDYNPSSEQYFLIAKVLRQGLLLSVLRPIASDDYSYYAAALFFPAGIKVSAGEKINIIEAVKNFLNGSDPDADSIAAMREMLSRNYSQNPDAPLVRPSSGHHIAWALYGGDNYPSLQEYASVNFYQPEFSDFAEVVLLDAGQKARGNDESTELSRPHLERLVRVNPPAPSPDGFSPMLGRRPFTSPILATPGSALRITWHKNGFESVTDNFKVSADDLTPEAPDTSSLRRIISAATFHITGAQDQRLDGNCNIKINGQEISAPKAFKFAELRNAHVEISAPGYVAFNGHFDLATTSQVLVKMTAQHKTYRFDLPIDTPDRSEPIRLYIKSKKPIEKCPIVGYNVEGKLQEGSGVTNRLVYTGGGGQTKPQGTIIAALAAAALVIGLALGWVLFHNPDGPASTPITVTVHHEHIDETTPASAEMPTAAVADIAQAQTAIAYLDSNKTWNRSEMEAIADLQGLYDDLNSYNFTALSGPWATKLSGSANFATVLRAVAGAAGKRDPRTGGHKPTFAKDNNGINWKSYTYWIDP